MFADNGKARFNPAVGGLELKKIVNGSFTIISLVYYHILNCKIRNIYNICIINRRTVQNIIQGGRALSGQNAVNFKSKKNRL